MTSTPPAWITRLHQAEARRGERCRRCGRRKVIDTEQGPHCAQHAAQLPPPIVRREHDDHDLEHDEDGLDAA